MVSARGRNREKDLYVSRGFTSAVPRQHVEVVCATLEYEEFSKGQLLELRLAAPRVFFFAPTASGVS